MMYINAYAAFCDRCCHPVKRRNGTRYPARRYGRDTRPPRPRCKSQPELCNVCWAEVKEVKVPPSLQPRPPKLCPCGAQPEMQHDGANDEEFVACMTCGREGRRVDCTEYERYEQQAKIEWSAGRLSREGD